MLHLGKVLGAKPKEHVKANLRELLTPWGEQLDVDRVLGEHPTPQFARERYQMLNGTWRCAFVESGHDPALGPELVRVVSEAPLPPDEAFDRDIVVPFSPEAPLSGARRQLRPSELLWYRRTFAWPSLGAGERLVLHFQAVDYACCCWVNGVKMGTHAGGYTPFSFDITDAVAGELAEGGGEIVLCVADPSELGGQLRGKQRLDRGDIWYTAQSGIWQAVWLEVVPAAHIVEARIEPDAETGILVIGVRCNLGEGGVPSTGLLTAPALATGTRAASGMCVATTADATPTSDAASALGTTPTLGAASAAASAPSATSVLSAAPASGAAAATDATPTPGEASAPGATSVLGAASALGTGATPAMDADADAALAPGAGAAPGAASGLPGYAAADLAAGAAAASDADADAVAVADRGTGGAEARRDLDRASGRERPDDVAEADGMRVKLVVRDAQGAFVGEASCVAEPACALGLHVPQVRKWSPESPHLYQLELTLGADVVRSYCGFRTVEVRRDGSGCSRVFLNGEPLFVKGVLDQGYWSDGLMTAPSDDALVFDIMQMRAAGFNLMRKHLKVESARWYYHCDRLGMLVMQDMVQGGDAEIRSWQWSYKPTLFRASWGRYRDDVAGHRRSLGAGSAAYRREWVETCREVVRLLAGHPSVIVWCLFNEGWGQFDAAGACELVRRLDPTRPVDAVSGWYDQRCGDFSSVHNYFRDLAVWPCRRGRAFLISEFGGFSHRVEGHSSLPECYGYEVHDDVDEWRGAVCKLLAEAGALEGAGLAGYVYTQVSDIEEETNGILAYDRRVNKLKP